MREYSSYATRIQFLETKRTLMKANWLQYRFDLEKTMQQVQFLTVTEDENGQRLDNYLLTRLKSVPKSAVYKIIRRGEVRVNKGRAKPDRRLAIGDLVRVPPLVLAERPSVPSPGAALTKRLEAAVLFDRDGLLVINKPSGLAVHGGSGINLGLIEAMRQLDGNRGFLELVHRLDRDTSGCIMIARKRSVLKHLQDLLRQRNGVAKHYVALVQGVWPKHTRLVDVPLKRLVTASGERVVHVHQEGKPSQTQFSVLKRFEDATLVAARPLTGRTHQIRVHAKHAGCPLVGDLKYGETSLNAALQAQGFNRLFLHAQRLRFSLPNDEILDIQADLPQELQRPLANLPEKGG